MMTGHPQQRRVLHFQALAWRQLREPLTDGLPLLEAAAEQSGAPLWYAMQAWFHATNDDADAARAATDRVDRNAFDVAERRFHWWIMVASLVTAVRCTKDTELAGELYPLVLPYRDRNCCGGQSTFFGAVAHYLGVLATTIGEHDAAVEHFEAALERHRDIDAPPFVAMTQVALADALDERDAPGDADAARQLREDAATTIDAFGLERLREQAAARLR
jgi:hypothetical protein